jgi:SAM-dependent methyltransferase
MTYREEPCLRESQRPALGANLAQRRRGSKMTNFAKAFSENTMSEMKLQNPGESPVSTDLAFIGRLLPLRCTRVLELGCGRALTTRQLAETFPIAELIATEVDRIQHNKNLEINDLPRVTFQYGRAEDIDQPDGSIDAVIMLKSLHHVPVGALAQALREIHRVLKPKGLAYISEPVYAGAFNDILRLFHDEQQVRQATFAAVQDAVTSGLFELVEEIFFDDILRFRGFAEFEELVLGATHSQHELDQALYQRVKDHFLRHAGPDGVAEFRNPQRVDLLGKRDHLLAGL